VAIRPLSARKRKEKLVKGITYDPVQAKTALAAKTLMVEGLAISIPKGGKRQHVKSTKRLKIKKELVLAKKKKKI
jgi:hypothetical protein